MIVDSCNGIEVSYPKDCGNAPKKLILANLYKSVSCGDYEPLLENITENTIWNILGDENIAGSDKIILKIKNILDKKLKSIKLENIITHGNVASVNGLMTFENDSIVAFVDIYKFSGFGKKAKIKEISSYYIEL